jgi:tetratricopeptide (TPR) repeat protein
VIDRLVISVFLHRLRLPKGTQQRNDLISIPTFAREHARQFKSDLREAEEMYERGYYAASLSLLDRHAMDPAVLFLIGRDYYMLGEFKKATGYLKHAAIAAPANSEFFDWLGRAYVRRALTLQIR